MSANSYSAGPLSVRLRPADDHGFSLIEVLLALAITSSVITLLMGAVIAFANIADRMSRIDQQRDEQLRRDILVEPYVQRVIADRNTSLWTRRNIEFYRAASRFIDGALVSLSLEDQDDGAIALQLASGAEEPRTLATWDAEDAWFEFLTERGWMETFHDADFYPPDLVPGVVPQPPASPLAVRAVIQTSDGERHYSVVRMTAVTPERRRPL